MAKWLKDYLNFGSRRDPPLPPRPDYTESEIQRAYRAQKDLDFEDPYQTSEKEPHNATISGTLSLPAFPVFGSILSNGVAVKVVSPKHRLIKVDSQEFGRCKIPQSPVTIEVESVIPTAPSVGDSDTDYSNPFDARPDLRVRRDWDPRPTPADSSSYMEPFEAQRVITGNGDQLYENPYEEKTCYNQRPAPGDERESRLPQDDERPADEYDLPWEWKKDNISKALAVQFEGADRLRGRPEQARHSRTSPTDTSSLRKPGDSLPVLGERVDPSLSIERQVWYHGALSRSEAEMLLTLCKESSYLVRNSQTCRSDYSLSLRSCKGFMHMKFTQSAEGHFVLGENSPPFSTIPEVQHAPVECHCHRHHCHQQWELMKALLWQTLLRFWHTSQHFCDEQTS